MNTILPGILKNPLRMPDFPIRYFAQRTNTGSTGNTGTTRIYPPRDSGAGAGIQLDGSGNIISWNKELERLNGYTHKEIIGQNFNIFFLPLDRQCKLPEHLLDMARRLGSARHRGPCVKKNGQTFCCSTVITANTNEEGKVTGFTRLTRPTRTQNKASYIIYTRK